jgi:hypothetical protein
VEDMLVGYLEGDLIKTFLEFLNPLSTDVILVLVGLCITDELRIC